MMALRDAAFGAGDMLGQIQPAMIQKEEFMDPHALFNRLAAFPNRLTAMVANVPDEDTRWKPTDGAWSIVEVVRHLEDEESEDFSVRVRMTFEDPTQTWPSIDPEGAAVERKYNEADLQASLARFVQLRTQSLQWLEPRLAEIGDKAEQAYVHPKFGPTMLGEVFAGWVAHDQLHLRQITKRLFQLTQRDAGNFSTRYAGDW